MRRRWWVAAVAALALALAFVFGWPAPRRPRTVWTAPWGPGGVATLVAYDGTRYGPLAFAAGRTDVVIADSFGRRLLLVPRAAGPARSVRLGAELPPVEDVSVGPEDAVDFACGGTLWRWRPGGGPPERLAQLSGPGSSTGLSLIEGLAALPHGAVVVDLLTLDRQRATRRVFVLDPGGERRLIARMTIDETAAGMASPPEAAVPAGGRAVAAGPSGAVYLLGFTRAGRRAVFRYDEDGRLRATLRLPAAAGRWTLVGATRSGRIYLGVNLGTPAGRVIGLSRRGRVVLSRALRLDGGVRLGTYVAAAPDGDLYVLDPRAAGLHLLEWRVGRLLAAAVPAAAGAR